MSSTFAVFPIFFRIISNCGLLSELCPSCVVYCPYLLFLVVLLPDSWYHDAILFHDWSYDNGSTTL